MKIDVATQAGAQAEVSVAQFTLYFLKLSCIALDGPNALVGYVVGWLGVVIQLR
jgi:hypothetical protein